MAITRKAKNLLDGEYHWMLERFVEAQREAGDRRPILDHLPEIIVEEVCRSERVLIAAVRYDVERDELLIGD